MAHLGGGHTAASGNDSGDALIDVVHLQSADEGVDRFAALRGVATALQQATIDAGRAGDLALFDGRAGHDEPVLTTGVFPLVEFPAEDLAVELGELAWILPMDLEMDELCSCLLSFEDHYR